MIRSRTTPRPRSGHTRLWSGIALFGCLVLAGCGITATEDSGYIAAQKRLNAARADAQVRDLARVPLDDAARTLELARDADDRRQLNHFVYLTEKKIDIARAVADRRIAEEKLKTLQERADAENERSRLAREVEQERLQRALREARTAQQRTEALRAQLSEFQARTTARGIVLTLSDVLFDSGRARLHPGAERSLEGLVSFLRENPDRRIVIEGYTDNTGSPEGNLKLSLERANSVKSFLVGQGIDADRIATVGHGQNYPVVSNDTMAGRQRNRRVEILIEPGDTGPALDAERQKQTPVVPPPDFPRAPAG